MNTPFNKDISCLYQGSNRVFQQEQTILPRTRKRLPSEKVVW